MKTCGLHVVMTAGLALLLAAGCGGGRSLDPGDAPGLRPVSADDPRVVRAETILEQADTVPVPGAHVSGTGTFEGTRQRFTAGTTMDLGIPPGRPDGGAGHAVGSESRMARWLRHWGNKRDRGVD